MKQNVRQQLFRKLKKENCFWSYDVSKMKSISDEALIEHVMITVKQMPVRTTPHRHLFCIGGVMDYLKIFWANIVR